MPRYIVKLPCDGTDYYLLWSSVVDAPVTYGMTLEEFRAFYENECGSLLVQDAPNGLDARMERVEETGTSDILCRDPVEQWTAYNRAGPDESQLTFAEIVEQWVREPRIAWKEDQDST